MNLPTTGSYSDKRYRCTSCDAGSTIGTNHWGDTYGRCATCSWRRPGHATVHVCLSPLPEGYAVPEPWVVVRLGDLATLTAPRRTSRNFRLDDNSDDSHYD